MDTNTMILVAVLGVLAATGVIIWRFWVWMCAPDKEIVELAAKMNFSVWKSARGASSFDDILAEIREDNSLDPVSRMSHLSVFVEQLNSGRVTWPDRISKIGISGGKPRVPPLGSGLIVVEGVRKRKDGQFDLCDIVVGMLGGGQGLVTKISIDQRVGWLMYARQNDDG